MPGPLSIAVLDDAVSIVVSNPVKLPKAGGFWVGGDVVIEFLGHASSSKPFAAPSGLLRVDQQDTLVSLSGASFGFAAPVELGTGGGGPVVSFGTLSAWKDLAGSPIVWVDAVRAALVDSIGLPATPNTVWGTNRNQQSSLRREPNQQFYVTLDADGNLGIDLGGLYRTLKIDAAKESPFVLDTAKTKLSFYLEGDSVKARLAGSINHRLVARDASVQATATSGLKRAKRPDSASWSPVDLRASELHMAGGWVRAINFASEQELLLGRVREASDTPAAATILRAPGNDVSWELDLTGALNGKPVARFHYRRPTAAALTPNAVRINRHFGVRIKGLGSRSGIRPVLDADLLAIDLLVGAGGPQFEYRAGGDVVVGTTLEASRLAPKPGSGASAAIDIPYADLSLRVEDDGIASPLVLDTSKHDALKLAAPTLRSRPAGFSTTTLESWELVDHAVPSRDFGLQTNGLTPALGDAWLNDFRTKGNPQNYSSLEHPGTSIAIDSDSLVGRRRTLARLSAPSGDQTKLTVTGPGSAKEAAAYSAFCIALGWAAAKVIEAGSFGEVFGADNFTVDFPKLDGPFAKDFVKKNSLAGLRVVFHTRQNDSVVVDGAGQFKEFINKNMPLKGGNPPELFRLPFAMGLSVVLFANGKYVYELDQLPEGDKYKRPLARSQAIAYDFDTSSAVDPVGELGWAAKDWDDAVKKHPAVWPRGKDGGRSKLDPLQPTWRGLFLKGMPLRFLAPPIVEKQFKWLDGILKTVNQGLELDYGWLDENGASWVGGFRPANKVEVSELPFYSTWKDVLRVFVLDAAVEGLGGKTVRQGIGLRFELPQIVDENTKEPLAFEGDFSYTPSEDGQVLVDITSRTMDGWFSSKSIPGFDKFALRKVTTDFKDVMQFEVDLVASAELRDALPVLSSDVNNPLKARIMFSLAGKPDAIISLVLPKEHHSTLFGKWPYAVRSITLDIGQATVRIVGRIETGLPGLQSIGATLVISGNPKVHLDVEIDEIKGEMSFGGFKIQAAVHWTKADGTAGGLPLADKASARDRDLWGAIKLTDPGLIGDIDLRLRIGSQGGMPYWVGSLQSAGKLNLGVAQLRNPFLLLAHNADYKDKNGDDTLFKLLQNPSKSILKSLQPDDEPDKWLARWSPSKEVGTTIAGGGLLHVSSSLLSTDEGDTDTEHLTAVIYNDTGLFRIDGFAFLINQYEVNFGIVIDWAHNFYGIGLQLPTMALPENDPKYTVQAGAIVLQLGINGRKFARLSIGWPERKGSDDFDRDWDKATKVLVDGMWPINTFQGGMLISWEDGKFITFGIAIRAGWTKQWAVGGGGIADASADAGIMVGGVFILSFVFDDESARAAPTPLRLAWKPRVVKALTGNVEDIQLALEEIDRSLAMLALDDVQVVAQLYGDLWGHATVRFMGVTLVGIHISAYIRFEVCGTLSKGIEKAWGKASFEVSVKILCVTYSTSAHMQVTLRDGVCSVIESVRSAASFAHRLGPAGLINQVEDTNG